MFESTNPATGEVVATYPQTSDDDLDLILERAVEAQESWAALSFGQRAEVVQRCAELLRERKEQLAGLMANEMGKPLAEGRSEAEKCAWVCELYAERAEDFLADQEIETDATSSYVCHRPIGVVLAIMPWNFPFWQVFRFLAPALMAGNGALLKHASNVSGCSLAIESLVHEAGVPEHLFRSLLISGDRARELLENPKIAAATLTGSTPAGRAVAETAGKNLKKIVLELGGSDPYVVLEDADLELAADTCIESRMINSGQSCIAAKRFVVVEAVRHSFEERVLERILRVQAGDPTDENVDIGPMARTDLRDDLHEQVEKSLAAGARRLTGGTLPDGDGAFYPPTLLADVVPGMPAYEEELFGPVASILPARDEEDAIRIANDTSFGLGAAVFTRDVERGEKIAADRLHAGCCFVNDMVQSDPRLPFGGIKDSGFGRELSGLGIREFVNAKTVYVK